MKQNNKELTNKDEQKKEDQEKKLIDFGKNRIQLNYKKGYLIKFSDEYTNSINILNVRKIVKQNRKRSKKFDDAEIKNIATILGMNKNNNSDCKSFNVKFFSCKSFLLKNLKNIYSTNIEEYKKNSKDYFAFIKLKGAKLENIDEKIMERINNTEDLSDIYPKTSLSIVAKLSFVLRLINQFHYLIDPNDKKFLDFLLPNSKKIIKKTHLNEYTLYETTLKKFKILKQKKNLINSSFFGNPYLSFLYPALLFHSKNDEKYDIILMGYIKKYTVNNFVLDLISIIKDYYVDKIRNDYTFDEIKYLMNMGKNSLTISERLLENNKSRKYIKINEINTDGTVTTKPFVLIDFLVKIEIKKTKNSKPIFLHFELNSIDFLKF